jgi:GNAT superfamily N-acetyltransferase
MPASSEAPSAISEYQNPVFIEAARSEDLTRLIEFRNVYFVTKTSLEAPTAPEDFLRLIVNGQWPGYVFVAKDETGEILGYAMTYLHPALGYGELEEIATNPAKKMKGLGGQLFDRCILAARAPNSSGAASQWNPVQRLFLMDYSILGQTAKLGLKRGFVPVDDVDKLYVLPFDLSSGETNGMNGFWRWRRPGFAAGDPRQFPKDLVPRLLRVASQHRNSKDHDKAIDDYRYILMFRPLEWRARWGLAWTYLKSWFPGIGFIAPVILAATAATSSGGFEAPTRVFENESLHQKPPTYSQWLSRMAA